MNFRNTSRGVAIGDEGPATGSWLPDMDLNHDKQIQSLLCYRYTIGQAGSGRETRQVRY